MPRVMIHMALPLSLLIITFYSQIAPLINTVTVLNSLTILLKCTCSIKYIRSMEQRQHLNTDGNYMSLRFPAHWFEVLIIDPHCMMSLV